MRGGVRRSRENVVVCDFRRVVAAWMAVRGRALGRSEVSAGVFESFEGVREVWKCARRV